MGGKGRERERLGGGERERERERDRERDRDRQKQSLKARSQSKRNDRESHMLAGRRVIIGTERERGGGGVGDPGSLGQRQRATDYRKTDGVEAEIASA